MSVQRTFAPGEVNHPAGSWVAVYPNGRERVWAPSPSARREATRAALMSGGRVYRVEEPAPAAEVADSDGGTSGGPAAADDQTGTAQDAPAAAAEVADSDGGTSGGPAAADDQTGTAQDAPAAAAEVADSDGGTSGGPAAADDRTGTARDGSSLVGEAIERTGDAVNAGLSGVGQTVEGVADAIVGKRTTTRRTARKSSKK